MLTTDVACSISDFARYFEANSLSNRLFISSPQMNIHFHAENAHDFEHWAQKRGEMEKVKRLLILRQFTDQPAGESGVEVKNVALGILDLANATITFLSPKLARQTYSQQAVSGVTITPPSDLNFVAIESLADSA